jgi:hypothetical protein
MLSEVYPFEVVRTKGGDEVLARVANLLTGRGAVETAKRPWDVIEPRPSPPPSLPANAEATALPKRHILPKDLPGAIKQLDDQELDRLFAAVVNEQKRRDRKPSATTQTSDKPRVETAAVHLTPGKMNAVRAAFKAGVKPSQIARQFGLSQTDVRIALASDTSRRAQDRG